MKISIIIPVYNVSEYLDKCLTSVIGQTYSDLEIVCVNDGSTDSSLDILKKYSRLEKRIIIVDQENVGLSGARNSGLAKSSGDFVMFLDSDDWLAQNACEVVIGIAEKK